MALQFFHFLKILFTIFQYFFLCTTIFEKCANIINAKF